MPASASARRRCRPPTAVVRASPAFKALPSPSYLPSVPEAERLFAALADGGQVQTPMTKTFFSPAFGMVADRFGVSWMIYVPGAPS